MKNQSISRSRLDRFISERCQISRRDVRLMLAQKRVLVDHEVVNDIGLIINKFTHIQLDQQVLQENTARYVMLHKPIGVVSATKDLVHQTVIDLLTSPDKSHLHIVGRLDLNTSGLILLTNDSRWSEKLTLPEKKVEKRYLVTLKNPLTSEYIEAFAKGFYFDYEGITTQPAKLERLSEYVARVTIVEGRYHQIKRMFGRFRNPVVALHREAIGNLFLDANLAAGQSRSLTQTEIDVISD